MEGPFLQCICFRTVPCYIVRNTHNFSFQTGMYFQLFHIRFGICVPFCDLLFTFRAEI